MNNNKILNISSDYNIRLLFSYLEYDSFVKVIKYNKLIQDKLSIKIDYNCNYHCAKKMRIRGNENKINEELRNLIDNTSFIDIFLFEYITIYNSIKFNIEELFSFNKLIGILFIIIYFYSVFFIDNSYIIYTVFFIPIIITCLLSFKAKKYICLKKSFHSFMRFFPSNIKLLYLNINIYGSKEEIKINIIYYVIIDFFTFIYDCYLEDFLANDFGKKIVILYYLFLIIHYIIIIFFYYKYFSFLKNYKYDNYIVEYKKIKIEDYYVPNFEKENNKEKFIKSICKNFLIKRSKEELEIIDTINNFRRKNNLEKFLDDNTFPDFLIKKQSEIILFPFKKIFKSFNDTKYICKITEKDKDFLNDSEIKIILLKDDLYKINVIKQNDII